MSSACSGRGSGRCRESTQGVVRMIKALEAHRRDRTTRYVMFMSENGFLLGEHRLLTKNLLYWQSISVPAADARPSASARCAAQGVGDDDRPGARPSPHLAGARPNLTVDGVS